VLASPLVRGAVTAIFWLRPPPFATKTFERASEAFAYGKLSLERPER
jgi:hypothetical protein